MIFNPKRVKTIYLMRHGKSSWGDYELSDHDRTLLPAGIIKTQKVAAFLKSKNISPDLIISSTAIRAFESSKIVASELAYPLNKIKTSKDIYLADEESIFNALFELDSSINSVMIFGHNPTFTDIVNYFKRPKIENLPTSGIAAINFTTEKWEDIPTSKFTFEFLVTPKMLK